MYIYQPEISLTVDIVTETVIPGDIDQVIR